MLSQCIELRFFRYKHQFKFDDQAIVFITTYYVIILLLKFSISSVSAPAHNSLSFRLCFCYFFPFLIYHSKIEYIIQLLTCVTLISDFCPSRATKVSCACLIPHFCSCILYSYSPKQSKENSFIFLSKRYPRGLF